MVRALAKILSLWAIAGILALAVCGSVVAQDTGSGNRPGAGDTARPAGAADQPVRLEETRPAVTYYVKDADGKLVPVIDMTYEDFVRLYNIDQELTGPDHPERFSIQEWTADGRVRDTWAEVDVTVKLLVNVDEWCRVPLGMGDAVLTEPPAHEGPGEFFVSTDNSTKEYVFWIRGGQTERHTLRMKLLVRLDKILGESRVRLRPPPTMTSKLALVVDSADVTASVSDHATLLPPQQRDDGTTQLTVVGVGTNLQLAWRVDDDRPPTAPAVFEARGSILVKVEGLRGITTERQLTLRSSNGPLDSFRVKLPPGARPVLGKQPTYAVFRVGNGETTSGADSPENVVEVRVLQPTSDPVRVKIITRQAIAPRDSGTRIDVGFMEVVDAVRQWGHIALQVTGEASVDWIKGEGVIRVDKLPEGVAEGSVEAGFEYAQQPSSLKLRVLPRTTRITVKPRYLVRVTPDAVRLDAQLSYEVRGAPVDSLQLTLDGWQLDAIEPAALVKVDALQPTTTGKPSERIAAELVRLGRHLRTPMIWPLRLLADYARPDSKVPLQIPLAQPTDGPFTIEVRAHRPLKPGTESLSFPLPRARANLVSNPSVIVLPDDNVRIEPGPDDILGLVIDQNPPRVELPQRDQEPLFYRAPTDAGEIVFAGKFSVRRRRVTVEQTTKVTSGARLAHVQQRLSYRVAHEPIDHLLLNVPSDMMGMSDLSFACDGIPFEPDPRPIGETNGNGTSGNGASGNGTKGDGTNGTNGNGTNEDPDDTLMIRVPLTDTRVGTHTVTVEYDAPIRGSSRDARSSLMLPLVVPVSHVSPDAQEGTEPEIFVFRSHTFSAEIPVDARLESPGRPWAAVDHTAGDSNGPTKYLTETPVDRLELGITFAGATNSLATTVRRAWIQPWLSPTDRRDRAAFRVRTAASQIRILLPTGADASKIEAFLNGVNVPPPEEVGREFPIELGNGFGQREYLIEMWYPFVDGRPARGAMSLELPQIVDAQWVKHLYVQIVLPPNEQLVVAPAALTSEMVWGWHGVRLGSQPQLETADIEAWMDTTLSVNVPAGANQYLFSRFGALPTVQFRTATRSLIALVASGVVLIAGLLWVYMAFARQPWIVLSVIAVFAFLASAYPEPAVFAAQVAALGLGLVIVARLLYWAIIERRVSKAVIHGTSIMQVDRSTTETQMRHPEGSSYGDSATVPAAPAAPAPNGNP